LVLRGFWYSLRELVLEGFNCNAIDSKVGRENIIGEMLEIIRLYIYIVKSML